MNSKNDYSSDGLYLFLILAGIGMLAIYKNQEYLTDLLNEIVKALLYILGLTVIIFVVFIIVRKILRRRKENEKFRRLSQTVREALLSDKYCDETIAKLLSDLKYVLKRFKPLAAEYINALTTHQQRHVQHIREEERLIEQRRQQYRDNWRQKVREVYLEFKKQGNTKAIPPKFKDYDPEIILQAEEVYQNEKREQWRREDEVRREQEQKERCFLFVYKNKGLPKDYAQLSANEKNYYDEALKLLNENKLAGIVDKIREKNKKEELEEFITEQEYLTIGQTLEEGQKRANKLLENDFYYRSDLTLEEQNFLQKFYKYKTHKISNFGDGFIPVIYKCTTRERPNHFCSKYLFARIHTTGKVEARDWYQNEVDVVFTKGKKKYAVEIERGTNKINYLNDKIATLKDHYHKVIIVAPRKQIPKYRMYEIPNQVYVLNAKKAKDLLLKWLN
ncbi:hypothetical protein ACFLZN_00235 [Nanoarchaeota archaeon]